jgi:hypothetical protein
MRALVFSAPAERRLSHDGVRLVHRIAHDFSLLRATVSSSRRATVPGLTHACNPVTEGGCRTIAAAPRLSQDGAGASHGFS